MPSSYTSSLRLTLPVQGELAGSWGNTVNSGITQLLDTAVAGTASITMTAANYTLTNNNGTTDEARSMFLVLGGTPGASYQVICPAVSKLYFVTNNTGFAQTVKTASGSGISVPNGARMTLRCDGTDVVVAQNYFASMTLGSALPVASGGTGLTSFTANGVVYASSTSALATGSGLVFDGTNLGVGTNVLGASKVVIEGTSAAPGVFNALMLRNNSDGGSAIIFDNSVSAPFASIEALVTSTGGGTDDAILAFGTATNGSNTEKMRLDSSGNLGVGTSSPYARLDVGGNTANQLNAVFTTGVTDANFRLGFVNGVAGGAGASQGLIGLSYLGVGQAAALDFIRGSTTTDASIAFRTNNTEHMRLDAVGVLTLSSAFPALKVGSSAVSTADCSVEVGVGRTGNGNAYIDLTGDTTYTDYGLRIIRNNGGANTASSINHRGTGELQLTCSEAASISFATNGTERARIGGAGDFIVGSNIVSGPGGITMASITSGFALVNNNNAAATGYLFQSFRRSSTEIGSITQNGTTAVLFNITSDRRLKNNITQAPSASDVIDAIEIVSHDWKAAPDEHVAYGVIAQDLALVAPQAVLQGDDGEEVEKTWGVDYSKLVPMLIKEIQSLRARVAALEAA